MEDFNAQQARQIVDSLCTQELVDILVDIKAVAEKGETVLHIYNNMSHKTKQSLIERGFRVDSMPSIAIQKDGLYYSIYW